MTEGKNSSTYIDKFKYVKEECNKAREEFKNNFDSLYEELNALFGGSNASKEWKKLSSSWKELDIDAVIGWYCKTFRPDRTDLIMMANEAKKLDAFCMSNKYFLPGIRPLHVLSEDKLKDNDNVVSLVLKKAIKKFLPLLYIYSEIIVFSNKQTNIESLIQLINTKNILIDTLKNVGDTQTKKLTMEENLKLYSQLNNSMPDLNATISLPSTTKNNINMGPIISYFIKKFDLGGEFDEKLKLKIKNGLESGAVHKLAGIIISYYMEREARETAGIIQDIFNLVIYQLSESIVSNDKMIPVAISLFDQVMKLLGPELESKRINPKDVFATILEKIKSDPSKKGAELVKPLEDLCSFIETTTDNKNIDKKNAIGVLTKIFCAVNKCDEGKAQTTFEPIINMLDKIQKPDGSIDFMKALEAVNNMGGIEKIKDTLKKLMDESPKESSTDEKTEETKSLPQQTVDEDNKEDNKEEVNISGLDMTELIKLAETCGIVKSDNNEEMPSNVFLDENTINSVLSNIS